MLSAERLSLEAMRGQFIDQYQKVRWRCTTLPPCLIAVSWVPLLAHRLLLTHLSPFLAAGGAPEHGAGAGAAARAPRAAAARRAAAAAARSAAAGGRSAGWPGLTRNPLMHTVRHPNRVILAALACMTL